MQNRLAVTMSNLQTYSTNLEAANVASETARLRRQQILVQAGAWMLAPANQGPQIALSLLR